MDVGEILDVAYGLYACGWGPQAHDICRQVAAAGLPQDGERLAAISRAAQEVGLAAYGEHQPIGTIGEPGRPVVHVISTLQFTTALTPFQKRVAFRSGVRLIDLETSSQCNRRCRYCVNAVHDRLTENRFMPWPVYQRVIDDLASIDWSGRMAFHGYNEPLMHADDLVARIEHARSRLPHAALMLFSNGDYLTRELLDRLARAGLDNIELSVHLSPDKAYNERDLLDRIFKKANQLGLQAVFNAYAPDAEIGFALTGAAIPVAIRQRNYMVDGHSRGGILEGVGHQVAARTAPCLAPLAWFVIGHGGNVVPCCTLVSDAPEHRDCVIGNVNTQSIFDIYGGDKAVAWRRAVMVAGEKTGPCKTCATMDAAGRTEWQDYVCQAIALVDQSLPPAAE